MRLGTWRPAACSMASLDRVLKAFEMSSCTMTQSEVLQLLGDPAVAARVDRAVAEAERSGVALRQRARSIIGEALQKLAATVSGDDVSHSFLLRVVDVLGKQAAEPQDKGQGAQPTFTIHIDLGDQSVSLTGTPHAPGEVIDV